MLRKILILFVLSFGIVTFGSGQITKLSDKQVKAGWKLLFDGKTTNGWTTAAGKPVTDGWEIKYGVISTVKGGKGGDIVTVNEYSNFELSMEFRIQPGENSGIKYFYTTYAKGGNLGMEYQILDNQLAEDNKKANHLCGSFYDVLAPSNPPKINPPGKWNAVRIVAKGKHVEHWLNGKKILEFTRGSKAFTDSVAVSKFNKTEPPFGTVDKGKILLQEHGGVASFRSIKIRTL